MASRRAGRPWWGTGDRWAPSERTWRVSRAQRAEGKKEGSAWPLFKSSHQAWGGASAGSPPPASAAGRRGSTEETKKPRRGRAST